MTYVQGALYEWLALKSTKLKVNEHVRLFFHFTNAAALGVYTMC